MESQVTCRCLAPKQPMRLLTALCVLTLVLPTAALDDDSTALTHTPSRQRQSSFVTFVFFGYVILVTRATLGPLMGISSILWLMMRNDPAISPKSSWMVFGVWAFLTLTYLFVQCHRVYNHQLYMLLTLAAASCSLCIIAIIERSTLQAGLVTVIPPCTSFAAYTIAYLFPDRFAYNSTAIV